MKKIIILLLSLVLISCGTTNKSKSTIKDTSENNSSGVKKKAKEKLIYADDEIVNKFISEFQEIAGYEMTDISKGNIRTKYFAYANNCYLEMINATDAGAEAFCISYSFGSLSEEEIYSVFTDCLKTLGATDEEIEKTIADFTTNNDGDYMIEGYETNSSITCTYCPTKELSNGTSIGHIEIASSTFGK